MPLDKAAVEHVALLARLNLSETEKTEFARQLSSILGYVDKLQELNTDQVRPLVNILSANNVLRDDEERPRPLSREELLANGPSVEAAQFKVPKIL
ncbi:MAG: Asp-tRNA(Asn)/Glu-tRNA(Gln) amidotransferase subunit GatC [Syntrophomonadaceae bacterium]|jgi:aspartyl-tRNA(Asn)/glutamyl-tRNA(Gln) amidotransferase subunit C|nr:Asp-tRNA(Asn)/Glu-tRNA(Gln) amidotransferase subunit GatC [Syntrophomonadaceae bacterium]